MNEQGESDAPGAEVEGELDSELLGRLLLEAGALLGVSEIAPQPELVRNLREAVAHYVTFKSILPHYGAPKQQKQLIEKLVASLDRTLLIIDGIAPEYMTELEAMIERASPEEERRVVWDTSASIRKLRDAACRFLRGYEPKKGATTNLPLEEAVRTLIPLVEGATGGTVTVSQNKNKPGGPSLRSSEGRAIGILLQGIDPALTTTAIVNMIEKVRNQPEESESHLWALMHADPMAVLDMSLWEAAGKCGFDEVPVIRVQFLSEADRRAFALAHNRLAELSDWDDDLLAQELEFLFDQDYDLGVTGFDLGDLDLGISKDAAAAEEPIELPDENARAVTRPGDLWLIGPHRLLCGNARDAVSYEALLAGEVAAMVFSDPPYNVPIAGHVSGLGQIEHREFEEASGEMSSPEFTAFLRAVFRNCVRFSADGSIHYQCMDWRHVREILDAADGVYTEFKQLAVWAKSNAGMGAFYRSQHELVFVFKSGRARHQNHFGLGDKGRHRTNVWNYAGATTFRKGRARDLADHPTVKPVAMVADAVLDCSSRGDLILDPFSGSGTTLLAAHRTRRRGAAIELDPLYVDVALRRLQAASGLMPTLDDGRTMHEIAAERAEESADV